MNRSGSPAFAVRGVIEGFYGRPWTQSQRLDLIEFIAERGMNTFVYSPKDDPMVRRRWAAPYEDADIERMSELVEQCRRLGVDFVYCLSPGLSIRYSDSSDVAALCAKFDAVAQLGVTKFGLLLDDIPMELQHAADRDAFDSLVAAHSAIVTSVFSHLGPRYSLIVCPTVYWGYGDEDYVTALGHSIDPRIEMFWTGRAICSATLDLADAAAFARSTLRLATYWDNYPVNDVQMTGELHIGPYQGRDRHLYRFSTGVIANPMELFEASKIAISTIADYLWSPEEYDPETSWQRALRDVVGEGEDFEAFALFADTVRFSCLSPVDAPVLSRTLETFGFRLDNGDEAGAARELADTAGRMLAAADRLLRGPFANRALLAEARPWIETFEVGATALAVLAELAASGRIETDGQEKLGSYLATLRASHARVFGSAVEMTLADLIEPYGAA